MKSKQHSITRTLLASVLVLGASAVASPALAAVFTVNDTNDRPDANAADGLCRTVMNTCTLRAAVMQSNATVAPDTIRLQGGATYILTRPGIDNSALNGDLDIRRNVLITVLPAASLATVRGNGLPNDGIFHVIAGNNVRIERVVVDQQGAGVTGVGVQIEPGARLTMDRAQIVRSVTTANGAGIRNGGELMLNSSLVALNQARGASGGGAFNGPGAALVLSSTNFRTNTAGADGGAIYSRGRIAMRQGSTLLNNSAMRGGAIFQQEGGTSMLDSTLTANQATDRGGAVFVRAGRLDMNRSTADSNRAGVSAGGLWNSPGGALTLTNSTLSGNRAQRHGGGMYNDGGRVGLFSTTITANTADTDNDGIGSGGGIFSGPGGNVLTTDAILARNTRRLLGASLNDCSGPVRSAGWNLVGTNSGCGFIAAAGDQVGTAAAPIDPRVGPLAANGGPTRTHALLVGSRAIDRGNPAGCRDQSGALLTTDQRGFPRPRDGNGDGIVRCDVGSFERQ